MCVEIKDPFKQIHTHTRWLFLYEFDGKMMMTMMMMMYREKFFFSFRKKIILVARVISSLSLNSLNFIVLNTNKGGMSAQK